MRISKGKKLGEPPRTRTVNRLIKSQLNTIKLLNNLDLSTLALCQLDCHDKAVWYPEDDICHSKAISKPSWVSAQRKIKRFHEKGLVESGECFTRSMLEGLKRIGKGLHGMKPEKLYRKPVDISF